MASKTDQASADVVTDAEVAEQEAASAEALAKIGEEAGQLGILVSIIDAADRFVGKVWTIIGARVDHGAFLVSEQGQDWTEWALSLVPRSKPIVYKVRQAGAVARVLNLDMPTLTEAQAGDMRGTAEAVAHLPGYLTLLPAYRLLKEAKSAENPAKARKEAEQKIRKAWAELTEGGRLPKQEESEAKFSRFGSRPTTSEGTSDDGGSNRNEPTEGDSPAHTLTVTYDSPALESLTTDFGSQMDAWQEQFSVSRETIIGIALGTLRFGAERGFGNLEHVLTK